MLITFFSLPDMPQYPTQGIPAGGAVAYHLLARK
jgi:hypothetical protein